MVIVNSAPVPVPLELPVTPVNVAEPVDVPEPTLTVAIGLLFSRGSKAFGVLE